MLRARFLLLTLLAFCVGCADDPKPSTADPLPSWNATPTKQTLLDFVHRVTTPGSDFVPVPERIAVFDNDGTLWCEQPMYVQVVYIFDRVKALAGKRPEWKDKQPFKAVLDDDRKALAALGEKGFGDLLVGTQADMTSDDVENVMRNWLATARQPRFKRPYTQLAYQPMLEVLTYLRAKQFKTYIVSGGGVDFMRVFTEKVYGVPPEQVLGSSLVTSFEERDGKFVFVPQPKVNFVNDRAGKPVNIHLSIGRQPVIAFGNSDGDLQMLQYTTAGTRPRLGLLVHHDDGEREYAYDRKSSVGRLDKALDEAEKRKWTVISMKKDWKTIFVDKE